MELLRCAQVLACTVLLLGTMMAMPTNADCPDADIRCRIPMSDLDSTSTTSGCEAGAAVEGAIEGEVTSGKVTLDGKCYYSATENDDVQFLPVGTISNIGQCYDALHGGCQPENCADNSAAQHCNEQLSGCQVRDSQAHCSNTYKVAQGDDASAIANSNGITVDDLQADNPDMDLTILQPNQELCLKLEFDYTPKCEGKKISG